VLVLEIACRIRGILGLALIGSSSFCLSADDIRIEDLLQKNLNSIGTAEARNSAKTRVVQGIAAYRLLIGGSGEIAGKCIMVSEDSKLHLLLKVNAIKYHGEKFIRNSGKTFTAGTYDDKTRSEFGAFLRGQDAPLREGLIGGELSLGWPLLDIKTANAKLRYNGLKTVKGRSLHSVSYLPKKGTDLDITLYFDPETFQHVLTLYTASIHSGIGMTETESARQNEARYRIEERFSDFKSVDGLHLPSHYDLRFQQELQNGFTKLVEWDVNVTDLSQNIPLDPKNFDLP